MCLLMACIVKQFLCIMCSEHWDTLNVVKQTISYVCQSWKLMKYDCCWKSRNNIANRIVNCTVVINILTILWKGKVLRTGSFVSWKPSRNWKSVCSFSSPIPSLCFLLGICPLLSLQTSFLCSSVHMESEVFPIV